jgi:hypothetical protein
MMLMAEMPRCDAGRADITPPVGISMGGFINRLSPCQGGARPTLCARRRSGHANVTDLKRSQGENID